MVLAERRSKPISGELEILGSYHPKTKDTVIKDDRILYWLSKGAKASDTVHNLLIKKGIVKGKKIPVALVGATPKTEKGAAIKPKSET